MSSLLPEKAVHSHANGSFSQSAKVNKSVAPALDLSIGEAEDDSDIRAKYRPFILDHEDTASDWVSELELDTVIDLAQANLEMTGSRLKILVLYGSQRQRSYSKLAAFKAARILYRLGCDARVYNPSQLPIRDSVSTDHPAVQELRELSLWSDAHIDWIPLSTGSVNGGSQSFNTVNSLRILGRWIRIIPTAFNGKARLLLSGNRDRLVDCMEELVKYTILMRPHHALFGDRYSERKESAAKAVKNFSNNAVN
ncbi:flavoprotein-like protein [Emericellopsis atlantica]|uniref:Flavoprotein-like protein n=1 Tax=Emericellopsis atlantica TaxID=2614577 RepID=A0A9P7ZJD4_9HYPO|nr:flavoprotein-like protein [Emericellopsis atlantica]KAG9252695.1 flavoprotein-like protein [Emericellopsis atlantica]